MSAPWRPDPREGLPPIVHYAVDTLLDERAVLADCLERLRADGLEAEAAGDAPSAAAAHALATIVARVVAVLPSAVDVYNIVGTATERAIGGLD